jgi:hypothetical protein
MRFLCGTGKSGTPHLGSAYHRNVTGFDDLILLLRSYREIERHPDSKDDYDWFSPMVLHDGAQTRNVSDINYLTAFLAVDIDEPGWSFQRLREALEPVKFIAYTTTSSTPEAQRWRIVLPLTRTLMVEEYPSIFRGINILLYGAIDFRTRNVNRISYLPATWHGGDNEFHVQDGIAASVDAILECYPIEPPPPPPPYVPLIPASEQVEIIQDWMVTKEIGKPQGGRMFRVLQRAAARFKRNGWCLTAQQLADAATAVKHLIPSSDRRTTLVHEAQNAIDWAAYKVETTPELSINLFKRAL